MIQHHFRRHWTQVELQAPAQHRNRHLLRVSRGEHELQILRRLFQRLEHGVESRVGEHMHFVDHEDLEAPLHRLVDGLLKQLLHFVDPAVARSIELGVVNKAARIDFCARRADTTRGGGNPALPILANAIERFGQNP